MAPKDTPASRLPKATSSRARRFPGSSTATANEDPSSSTARSASTSENAFRPVKTGSTVSHAGSSSAAVNDSTACTRASMPANAVTPRGAPRVSSGSTIAVVGTRWGLEIPTFVSRSGSDTTATGVTSDPVPAVVGMATRGSDGPGTRFSP